MEDGQATSLVIFYDIRLEDPANNHCLILPYNMLLFHQHFIYK